MLTTIMMSLILMLPMHWSSSMSITMFMVFMMLISSSQFMVTNINFINDSMNNPLIMLTLWISALMLLASFNIKNVTSFKFLTMMLMTSLIMFFSTTSLMMFYMMFELSLIPIMLMIIMWGYQPERLSASMYLIMYTVMASLPLLVMIMLTINSYPLLINFHPYFMMQLKLPTIMWLMILMAFLVKIPMYLFHLWLPKAHVEAPVAGSMILAAILLKLGGFGIMRMISIIPPLNLNMNSQIWALSITGMAVTATLCIRQTDLKALIAYSSVSHMALMISALMSPSLLTMSSALALMIAHGLSSSALFAIAAATYDKINSRSMILTKTIMIWSPMMCMMWFMLCILNMSAPPSINMLSEIFLVSSIFASTPNSMFFISFPLMMTGVYSILMYTYVSHGKMPQFFNTLWSHSSRYMSTITLHLIPSWTLFINFSIMSWLLSQRQHTANMSTILSLHR